MFAGASGAKNTKKRLGFSFRYQPRLRFSLEWGVWGTLKPHSIRQAAGLRHVAGFETAVPLRKRDMSPLFFWPGWERLRVKGPRP